MNGFCRTFAAFALGGLVVAPLFLLSYALGYHHGVDMAVKIFNRETERESAKPVRKTPLPLPWPQALGADARDLWPE